MLDRISFHSHLSPPYWTHYHSQFNFENMNIFWMRIKVKALAQGLWLDWIDVRVTPHVLHNHVYRMGILLHYQKERERERVHESKLTILFFVDSILRWLLVILASRQWKSFFFFSTGVLELVCCLYYTVINKTHFHTAVQQSYRKLLKLFQVLM